MNRLYAEASPWEGEGLETEPLFSKELDWMSTLNGGEGGHGSVHKVSTSPTLDYLTKHCSDRSLDCWKVLGRYFDLPPYNSRSSLNFHRPSLARSSDRQRIQYWTTYLLKSGRLTRFAEMRIAM